jgi:hypothetical protein
LLDPKAGVGGSLFIHPPHAMKQHARSDNGRRVMITISPDNLDQRKIQGHADIRTQENETRRASTTGREAEAPS